MFRPGPTLEPYVPVSGPEWERCGPTATCRGINERCVARGSSSDADDDNGSGGRSGSDSGSGGGHCRCTGGFSRRGPHEPCRRRSRSLLSRTIALFFFYCATHLCIARSLLSKDGWLVRWMSHAGIVSKRLKISSHCFLGLVALPLWFSNTALWLRNSNGKGSLSLGWT